jgi:hypothetical protein
MIRDVSTAAPTPTSMTVPTKVYELQTFQTYLSSHCRPTTRDATSAAVQSRHLCGCIPKRQHNCRDEEGVITAVEDRKLLRKHKKDLECRFM